MIIDIIFILANITMITFGILSIIKFRKNKFYEEILFESREFLIYKFITIFGTLVILLIPIIIFSMFKSNNLNYNDDIQRFTFISIFLFQWINVPRRFFIYNKGFYYLTRFNGLKPICEFDNLKSYRISSKGRISLYFKHKGITLNLTLLGKLNEQEIKVINEMLTERGLKSRNY